jgi:hypothetical protein
LVGLSHRQEATAPPLSGSSNAILLWITDYKNNDVIRIIFLTIICLILF